MAAARMAAARMAAARIGCGAQTGQGVSPCFAISAGVNASTPGLSRASWQSGRWYHCPPGTATRPPSIGSIGSVSRSTSCINCRSTAAVCAAVRSAMRSAPPTPTKAKPPSPPDTR